MGAICALMSKGGKLVPRHLARAEEIDVATLVELSNRLVRLIGTACLNEPAKSKRNGYRCALCRNRDISVSGHAVVPIA